MTALLIGILFAVCVVSVGYGVLRLAGVASRAIAFGLSPAAGLAVLIVATVWTSFLGAPPLAGTVLLVVGVALGAWMAARELPQLRPHIAGGGEARITILLMGLSLVVPAIILGGAFNSVEVPLSTHDGAHHVEIINQLRQGGQWAGWYPRGFHSTAAAFLQLLPTVDTALGTLGVGLGLALLAPVGVFGLGVALLQRRAAAATAAILIGLTWQYPYDIQFWDGWPLAIGIILATGAWTLAAFYLRDHSIRWILIGALFAASIMLTHGTELYTCAIGLAFLLVAHWRQVRWQSIPFHLGLVVAIAAVLMAPYIPGLLDFYRGGGAQIAGDADLADLSTQAADIGRFTMILNLAPDAFAGIVVDAPLRLGIVIAGMVAAFRVRKGRLLAALELMFLGLAIALQTTEVPAVSHFYALTFPWGQGNRLLMIVAICGSLLGGMGLLHVLEVASRLRGWRFAPALLLVVAQATTALMGQRFAAEAQHYLTYSPDDALALNWVAAHIHAGELLVNDGSADAGIWAPYKAGATLLLPRVLPLPDRDDRIQLVHEFGDLDGPPDAVAQACDLGARYVYVGASGTAYEQRNFPTPETLLQSPALAEVFSHGDAAVFSLHCD
jgi:hypothetical protein